MPTLLDSLLTRISQLFRATFLSLMSATDFNIVSNRCYQANSSQKCDGDKSDQGEISKRFANVSEQKMLFSMRHRYDKQYCHNIHEVDTDLWMGYLSTGSSFQEFRALKLKNFGSNRDGHDALFLIHHNKGLLASLEQTFKSDILAFGNVDLIPVCIPSSVDPHTLMDWTLDLIQRAHSFLRRGSRVIILESPVSRHSEVVVGAVLAYRRGRTAREAVARLSLCGCARGSDTRQRLAATLAWREVRRSHLFCRLPDAAQLKILDLL